MWSAKKWKEGKVRNTDLERFKMPKIRLAHTTISNKILEDKVLVCPFPITAESFIAIIKKIAIKGRINPFRAWATIIAGMG